MQYAATTTECRNCGSVFHHCDRDEDGRPYIETTLCNLPGCEVRLCGATCQELSFECDSCASRFCNAHLVLIPDGTDRPLNCCPACAGEVERIAPVPIRPERKYKEVA